MGNSICQYDSDCKNEVGENKKYCREHTCQRIDCDRPAYEGRLNYYPITCRTHDRYSRMF